MPSQKTRAKVDPVLTKQLDSAAGEERPVEAVVMLRQASQKVAADPEDTEKTTYKILHRVESLVGKGAKDVNIFRNLGSFVVAAEPDFLRELVMQPEVASVVANQQPYEAAMPPVKKRAVRSLHKRKSTASKKVKSAKAQ